VTALCAGRERAVHNVHGEMANHLLPERRGEQGAGCDRVTATHNVHGRSANDILQECGGEK
jgi:hypothetical protein